MPRPSLTEAQRREIRHSIRSAAAKLYAENGMKDISARSVAKAADVSVGTIYAHFGSLAGLMQSFWKEPVRKLITHLTELADAESDPIERLTKLANAYFEFAMKQKSVYRGSFMFVRPESHEKPQKVSLEEDRLFSLFSAAIADCQKAGQVRAGDPNELTQMLWSGMHGAIALPINVDRLALVSSEEMGPRMIAMLLEWLQQT